MRAGIPPPPPLPPGPDTTPRDHAAPLRPCTHPQDHAPPPGPCTLPPQSMLGDTVNARAVRILLECNLVLPIKSGLLLLLWIHVRSKSMSRVDMSPLIPSQLTTEIVVWRCRRSSFFFLLRTFYVSCLGLLMKTSALGFKTWVDASLVCFVRTDAADSTPVSTPAHL